MSDQRVLRILVVDDEQVIASTLATILQRHGHSVTFFTNPLEALQSAFHTAPDLLISDIMMPEMSGVTLAIGIKQQCPNCNILLFSAQAESEDLLADAREAGWSFQLLCKPIHPREILRHVEEQTSPIAPSITITARSVAASALLCEAGVLAGLTLAA